MWEALSLSVTHRSPQQALHACEGVSLRNSSGAAAQGCSGYKGLKDPSASGVKAERKQNRLHRRLSLFNHVRMALWTSCHCHRTEEGTHTHTEQEAANTP